MKITVYNPDLDIFFENGELFEYLKCKFDNNPDELAEIGKLFCVGCDNAKTKQLKQKKPQKEKAPRDPDKPKKILTQAQLDAMKAGRERKKLRQEFNNITE